MKKIFKITITLALSWNLLNIAAAEELIIVSDAMDFHMMNGGPMGHAHGSGPGMMGSHMGM